MILECESGTGKRHARWPLVAFAVCIALAIAAPGVAQAQSYPRKLVRIVVGLTAGGGVDTVTRVLARKMSESTGQQFVIDNRPGAGGNIAFEIVAKAEPDGYTIMNSTTGVVVNPALYRKVPYRIEDFAAVSLIGKAPMILVVHPSLPVHSVAELVKLVKAKPGGVRYGAPAGAASHLTMEVFRVMAGVDIQRVPYKGAPQALVDVINGQIEMTALAVPATMPLVHAKRLRALAQTGEKRSPVVADIPTMQEAGIKDYAVSTWYVIFGPAAMPPDVVHSLNAEILKALKFPDVQEQLINAGIGEIVGSSPAEATKFVQAEYERWAQVIKAAHMTAE
jgi:tripartite-type tricarboxylate transporter receptor subunit TctC